LEKGNGMLIGTFCMAGIVVGAIAGWYVPIHKTSKNDD